MQLELIQQFWEHYQKQRNDIANFDTFCVHFFPTDFWGPHQKRLKLLLDSGLSEPILEAGSGSGWLTFVLHQHGFRPVSVDVLEEQIAHSKILFNYFNIEGRWFRADTGELPFPDDHFSSVIAFDVLEHIEDLGETLQEFKRIIKADGRIFVTVPNGWGSYCLIQDRYYKKFKLPLKHFVKYLLGRNKINAEKESIITHHVHFHTKRWWNKQFSSQGFQVKRVVGIETISTAIFPRFGYKRMGKWSRIDSKLSEKLPSCLASEWFFELTCNKYLK